MLALVVDDSRATRMILRKILEQAGFSVEQAGDGKEALDLLLSLEPADIPDVAVVDWNMPEMNGLELVQALRENPDFDLMKIVMCTTETEISQMTLALISGANEYVMKPFTAEVLVGKLELIGLPVGAV